MKCDACDENATIFFTHLVKGNKKKVNLCQKCADEKGVSDPTGFDMADQLEGIGEEEVVAESDEDVKEATCEVCGFTQSDFKRTGRFGCSACYHIFDKGLDDLLEAMHKSTRHHGKVPGKFEAAASADLDVEETAAAKESNRLDELRDNLQASVDAEDYEEAARLRDAIAQLETELGSPEKAGDS